MYPILGRLGDLTFYTYGFVMMVSLFLVHFLAVRGRDPELLERTHLGDISFLVVFSIWFGGGLLSMAFAPDLSWSTLRANLDPTRLQNLGTMAITGAFTVSLWGYCLWKGLPFWRVLDFLMPYFILGYGLQRTFGCFSAGCCHGVATEMPWGVIFGTTPWGGPPPGLKVHPTQLYMGLAAIASSRWLLGQRLRLKDAPGSLTGLAIVALFGVYFLVTFWRADLKGSVLLWGLETSQLFSGALTLLGMLLWRISLWRSRFRAP
ncbi:MAG: prolipoprotein diacylglyceryl transferase [Magnetococcales bacterium]|nr:prolipoprotein diacylglyceryl transferase [Magnetococcales bacterium]